MTTPNHLNNESISSEAWRQQCMLYLLGELADNQVATFEQRLASSPEFGEELLRQADLIARISATTTDTLKITPLPSASRSRFARPVVVLIAIAACFALIVVNIRPNVVSENSVAVLPATSPGVPSDSEDLLIARAWVDNQIDNVTTDFGWVEPEVDDPVAGAGEELSDIDATLSWMFIAVSASSTGFETDVLGADALESGATNDG